MWTARMVLLATSLSSACSGGGAVHRLARYELQSAALAKTMAYEVWAPLDHRADERLPVLVFLHGGGDSENSFDEAQVGQHLDAELAAGRIPRAIVVTPDGDLGFWENWHDGSYRYRDWVVKEVLPTVQVAYHTLPCPEGCHVAGVSMGGHGTMRFAFFHGDLFASASCLSGPIFSTQGVLDFTGNFFFKTVGRIFLPVDRIWGPTSDLDRIRSEDLFLQWSKPEDLKGLRLMLAVAERDRDQILETNRAFHAHLEGAGIEHAYLEFPGEHKWVSWTPVIDRVLRFAIWGGMDVRSAP